jgi:hypothetical protein
MRHEKLMFQCAILPLNAIVGVHFDMKCRVTESTYPSLRRHTEKQYKNSMQEHNVIRNN